MGHASDRFRSSALPPNQYNEDSLPQAAILVILFSWRNPGLTGRNAQKQVFSHGRTTENLKNALSTPPNQLLQRCNGHSALRISCCNDVTVILPSESVVTTM
ncbi:hypothetical protein [Segatella oulorum]|uniref:hypothetical protein n=1 Tax=Segatella oulorum TaxID=28136 RepID=UPI0023EF81E3|nr:hypothetical protein [Segatella oulorum]